MEIPMHNRIASTFAALAAFACLTPAPSAAQEADLKIANPSAVIDTITPESVKALVVEMGVKDAQIRDGENNPVVTFVDGNLPYVFGITGCDIRPGKCLSLVMLIFVDMGASGITADMINARNTDSFFATSIKVDDKVIAFGRGVLVDSGVTRKNLGMNIAVYANLVRDGIKHFSSQIVASRGLPGTVQNLSYVQGQGPVRAVLPTPAQLNAALKSYDAALKSSSAKGRSW
jgi:hypothetical protein